MALIALQSFPCSGWNSAFSEQITMSESTGISAWINAGPLTRRDNQHLDVKQVHQEMLGIFIDVVPLVGRHLDEVPTHVELGAVDVARASDDDDLVFVVAADLGNGVAQLLMCGHAPFERTAFRMNGDLQDTVAPLCARGLRLAAANLSTAPSGSPPLSASCGWYGGHTPSDTASISHAGLKQLGNRSLLSLGHFSCLLEPVQTGSRESGNHLS